MRMLLMSVLLAGISSILGASQPPPPKTEPIKVGIFIDTKASSVQVIGGHVYISVRVIYGTDAPNQEIWVGIYNPLIPDWFQAVHNGNECVVIPESSTNALVFTFVIDGATDWGEYIATGLSGGVYVSGVITDGFGAVKASDFKTLSYP